MAMFPYPFRTQDVDAMLQSLFVQTRQRTSMALESLRNKTMTVDTNQIQEFGLLCYGRSVCCRSRDVARGEGTGGLFGQIHAIVSYQKSKGFTVQMLTKVISVRHSI